MKTGCSLRQFIETFPIPSQTWIERNIPENFNELSYAEKYKLSSDYTAVDYVIVLSIKNGHLFYGVKNITIKRVGNKFFKKSSNFLSGIYIDNKSIKISGGLRNEIIHKFLTLCNISWIKDLNERTKEIYLTRPSVFRAIITGKVYNQETLYKFIARRVFGIKDLSWRNCRTYCEKALCVSLIDVATFTKNVNDSIMMLNAHSNLNDIYRDVLNYAVQLNEIVDFTWSTRRLQEEHQRQICSVKLEEIESKDQTPIYKNTFGTENIKFLNTERDIYIEGTSMHHCLYDCYYRRIEQHNYMAFHMTAPEDCTFSVKRQGEDVVFDQIYLKHDKPVQPETRELAENFVKEFESDIIKCFNEPIELKLASSFPTLNEDLPW